MRAQDFKRWRKSLSLSQKQAAEALGLKRRVVQYYEKGERDGEKVKISKSVRLACAALAAGLGDYQGPPKAPAEKPAPRKPAAKKAPASKAAPNKTAAKKTSVKQAAAKPPKKPAKRPAAGKAKAKAAKPKN